VALGFFLRLAGRRRAQTMAPPPVPIWGRAASAALAVAEVALLVEATNLPVRFGQSGFEPWHWALVCAALLVAHALNLRIVRSLVGKRHVPTQP